MIKTPNQLKGKIKNIAKGDSSLSQAYLRTYMLERFLERVSLSKYKNNFIFKGGILVASYTSLNLRTTMDVDATIEALPVTEIDMKNIVDEIINVDVPDNVSFAIKSVFNIMEERNYPGLRFVLDASFGKIVQKITLDFSTGDKIVPKAIEYKYKLMFEDRYINLMTYNLENILAEKIETILSKGLANTRMRDYYDIYLLLDNNDKLDLESLKTALIHTCKVRGTLDLLENFENILNDVLVNKTLKNQWNVFLGRSTYAKKVQWEDAINKIVKLMQSIKLVRL